MQKFKFIIGCKHLLNEAKKNSTDFQCLRFTVCATRISNRRLRRQTPVGRRAGRDFDAASVGSAVVIVRLSETQTPALLLLLVLQQRGDI